MFSRWCSLCLCCCFLNRTKTLSQVRNLLGSGAEPAVITQNFLDFRPRYAKYHFYFGFCEFLNMCMVILSLFITDALLLNKFWGYGQDVLHYMWSVKHVGPEGQYLTHDPMCELFPTEVRTLGHTFRRQPDSYSTIPTFSSALPPLVPLSPLYCRVGRRSSPVSRPVTRQSWRLKNTLDTLNTISIISIIIVIIIITLLQLKIQFCLPNHQPLLKCPILPGGLLHQNRRHHRSDRQDELPVHPLQQLVQPEVLPGSLALVVRPHRGLRARPDLQIRQDHDPRPLQVTIIVTISFFQTSPGELLFFFCHQQ